MKGKSSRFRLDDLIIDTGSRQVTRDGVDLGITGLSFDLLYSLAEAAPDLLSFAEILDRVWPRQVVTNEALTQRVKLLRNLLEDDARKPRYIESRRGYGYRLKSSLFPEPHSSSGEYSQSRAQQLFMQAKVAMRGSRESRERTYRLLEAAIAVDPRFAPALAFRAMLQSGAVLLTGDAPQPLLDIERDALLALEINTDLADAHVALALVACHCFRWTEAEAHFTRAFALSPGDNTIRNLRVLSILRPAGRLREASLELAQSYSFNPAEGFTAHEQALTQSILGEDAKALEYVNLSLALSGMNEPHWDLLLVSARSHTRQGSLDVALECASKALPKQLKDQGGYALLELLYAALAGDVTNRRATSALKSFLPGLLATGVDGRTRGFFANLAAKLGAFDLTADILAYCTVIKAGEHPSIELGDLWQPEMAVFRTDPRFSELVRQINLPHYWKAFGPPDDFSLLLTTPPAAH